MLKLLPLSISCLALSLLGLAASEEFTWLDDLDEARAQAALEGKPVLAVFRCVP